MGKPQVARAAVFLDRDGVLNRPVIRNGRPHPPASLEQFELYEDVADGCARLKAAGFLLVVITNQPDVGRGLQRRETVEAMHAKCDRPFRGWIGSRFVITPGNARASPATVASRGRA